MRRVLVVLLAMVALAGCDAGGSGDVVTDYCSYGAVSQAQLDGCIDHVSESEVDGRNTNAARYARGELDECLADSGPFCESR